MWPNLQETADLVTFINESQSEKLHFLCSVKTGGIESLIELPRAGVTLLQVVRLHEKETSFEIFQ